MPGHSPACSLWRTKPPPLKQTVAEESTLSFLPPNLVDRVEPSNDPLITTCNEACAISFSRRVQ